MSERTPHSERLHTGLPPPLDFDPRQGNPGLEALNPEGTVVLLLTGEVDRQWLSETATELSTAWARGGRRIVLADLHLEDPILREAGEGPDLEGIVDIFLYGASLARIARPVGDGSFYVIPAGTYAVDPGEIHRHPRWAKLVAGFRDTNAALLLLAPAAGTELSALARWANEAILLGDLPDASVQTLHEHDVEVLAVLTPPDPTAVRAAPPAAAPSQAPGGSPALAADPQLELPPPPVRQRAPRRGVSALLWILFAVIVLATAGYLVATLRPDLVPWEIAPEATGSSIAAEVEPAAAPSASRLGELLPYSVQVRAFTSLAAARDELLAEQRRFSALPLFVSPEEIQGILYFKILAGLAPDTVVATRVRERLVQAGAIDAEDAAGSWSLLQFTPLAFDLGDFPTLEAAHARADSLLARQIPSYVAVVPYADGTRRWQLYGGAYRDSVSAARMREMLEAAGVPPRLTARTGAPTVVRP